MSTTNDLIYHPENSEAKWKDSGRIPVILTLHSKFDAIEAYYSEILLLAPHPCLYRRDKHCSLPLKKIEDRFFQGFVVGSFRGGMLLVVSFYCIAIFSLQTLTQVI